MPEGVWSGLKVLDLSQGIAGPFCARLLGDYGADVLKVEPPTGDVLRSFGPFHQDQPHPETCLFYLILNTNKRGITLNLETAAGRDLLKELVRDADVVIESFKPGYLAGLGLGYEELSRLRPGLIMTSITPFGQEGPYAGYEGEELIYYAMGGIMSISGTSDREPLKHGGFQAGYEAGLNAAGATGIAVLARDMAGEGTQVDVSIMEVIASTQLGNQAQYSFAGMLLTRRDSKTAQFTHPMRCADGWVISQFGGGATWETFSAFYEAPELLGPKFNTNRQRQAHGEEFDRILLNYLKDRKKFDLLKRATSMRQLFGVVQDPKDLAECPQLESRDFYREVDHPVIGRIKVPAVLFNFSATPYALRYPAPLLGQHNEEVYCGQLGRSREDLAHLRQVNTI